MRIFFVLLSLVALCYAEENHSKCNALLKYSNQELETMKYPSEKRFSPFKPDIGHCPCYHVITCNKIDYCIRWRCPDETMITAVSTKEKTKCDEADDAMSYLHKLHKEAEEAYDGKYMMALLSLFGNLLVKSCECTEKIRCSEKVNLCVSYICNNDGEVVSVLTDLHRFAAKVGGSRSISGSGGQPQREK